MKEEEKEGEKEEGGEYPLTRQRLHSSGEFLEEFWFRIHSVVRTVGVYMFWLLSEFPAPTTLLEKLYIQV